MKKKSTVTDDKLTKGFAQKVIRFLMLFFYVVSFLGFVGGFYAYTAQKKSQKTLVRYDKGHMPNSSFPVLVTRTQHEGHPELQLKYLYVSEYLEGQWKLHQTPGHGKVQIDAYDSGNYVVEAIGNDRSRITLNIWVGAGDGRERYVYEVEDNRFYPQSYQLTSYFGWMFSSLPLSLLATFLFILLSEIFYKTITQRIAVRKLKSTLSS